MILRFSLLLIFIRLFTGSAQENSLTIGTFNIKWLGDGIEDQLERENTDYAKIAFVLNMLDYDVLALQEIENESALKQITIYTDDYNLYISPSPDYQKVAFLVKKDIKLIDKIVLDKLTLEEERLRPGLILNLKKGNFDFIVANIHFKSTSRYDNTPEKRRKSFYYRKMQSKILREFLDNYSYENKEVDIILLGDFNDNPNKKYSNIKILNEDYKFLTKDMISCKNYLWSVIDHIAISESLEDNVIGEPFMLDLTNAFDDYELEKISDHCPVLIKISTSN